MKPLGRRGGRIPEFARNQTELGLYLMPPRDRKIIQKGMKLGGCPGRSPDGRYRIVDWQTFINKNFASAAEDHGVDQPDKRRLEEEKLRLTNDKLRFQLQVMQREFSANTDIEIWVGDLVMQAKRVLLAIPSKLAPQVIAMTEVEAEQCMKAEINAALAQLTSRPLHGDRYQPTAPAEPPAAEAPPEPVSPSEA